MKLDCLASSLHSSALHVPFRHHRTSCHSQLCCASARAPENGVQSMDRRGFLASAAAAVAMISGAPAAQAIVEGYTPMSSLKGKDYGKTRMSYGDYKTTPSGLQYTDLVEGKGESPGPNSTVMVDWDGYTIGYYGRPFEARNKAKGGSFTGDEKDFFRVQLGANQVIPAWEEAIASMKVGGIRRIVVPEEIGYPNFDFDQQGPRPSTFSGRRALDFVLKNQGLIDKTLLFDIELVRIVE